jgi:hypothetical protein
MLILIQAHTMEKDILMPLYPLYLEKAINIFWPEQEGIAKY